MAIIGYNVRGSDPNTSSKSSGRLYVSKYTLAVSGTLTELHCLFNNTQQSGGSGNARLVVYAADGASGNPGTRLYYSNLIATPGALGEYELAVTGISIPLAAGDYWLGWVDVGVLATTGNVYGESSGGFHFGWTTGAADPPPNPFGAGDTSGPRKHSVWGVVGSVANPSGIAQKVK